MVTVATLNEIAWRWLGNSLEMAWKTAIKVRYFGEYVEMESVCVVYTPLIDGIPLLSEQN